MRTVERALRTGVGAWKDSGVTVASESAMKPRATKACFVNLSRLGMPTRRECTSAVFPPLARADYVKRRHPPVVRLVLLPAVRCPLLFTHICCFPQQVRGSEDFRSCTAEEEVGFWESFFVSELRTFFVSEGSGGAANGNAWPRGHTLERTSQQLGRTVRTHS